ncbi:MAG: aldo/keto reductase [Defluviitaleaceae bacterium]|nr:aldo/keto reductase [Defluviitaleaceae bacterium]MCL2273938.1 aldo/keto reductase [Defluviitaleaceae bacterium]
MQYREDRASGNKLSALGMGCMRFPSNKAETERMILAAIKGGVNFFDTAYIYPSSEKTLGDILARNNKRKDVFIATKLPLMMCKTPEDFDRLFNEQLKRLQTDYIDYYFLHNVTDFAQWEQMRALGIEDWLTQRKKEKKIHNIGFSYHGTCDDFLKILASYNWGFTMIQYNYYDENYQVGRKGLQAAAQGGVSVIIMEPLLGGRLATGVPKKAQEIFAKADPAKSPADWALHWLWNQPEVTVVLSGMSNTAVLEKNLLSVKNFTPLEESTKTVYADVVAHFRAAYKINCTGCNYCLPCPKGINIPAVLSAYNARYVQGLVTSMTMYLTSTAALRKENTSPRKCNDCGKCEKHCPQYIPIRKSLKKVARKFEPLPMRWVLALVRKVMGG